MPIQERNWRLLDLGAQTGPMNMAVDEAIMRAHGRGEVPPTLRFYGWAPATVSIGYFQSMGGEVDLEAVRAGGYDYVRRITGGRMIFHHLELTYSVVIRQELLPGGVVETYQELSKGLLNGLERLGVRPELSGGAMDPRKADPSGFNTACFDTPSAYELVVGGRKLAGSAQTRSDGVLLQHGSILLDLDTERLFRLLKVPAESRDRLMARFRSKATSVREALNGCEVSYAEAIIAFRDGFAAGLDLTLTPGDLMATEVAEATELLANKYGHDSWNLKK